MVCRLSLNDHDYGVEIRWLRFVTVWHVYNRNIFMWGEVVEQLLLSYMVSPALRAFKLVPH